MLEDVVQAVGVQGECWRIVGQLRKGLPVHNLKSLAHQFILLVLQMQRMNSRLFVLLQL